MKVGPNSGFTLVELLVVVAIIALLAVFAVPSVKAAADSSRQTKVSHDMKAIQDAIEHYFTERACYPQKLRDLLDDGFLKPGVSFKSPVTDQWYLYAVDDNHDGHCARAYILATSSQKAAPNTTRELHHNLPIPKGAPLGNFSYAWVAWKANTWLVLYKDDDTSPLPESDYPSTLANYRTYCDTHPNPTCIVYTN